MSLLFKRRQWIWSDLLLNLNISRAISSQTKSLVVKKLLYWNFVQEFILNVLEAKWQGKQSDNSGIWFCAYVHTQNLNPRGMLENELQHVTQSGNFYCFLVKLTLEMRMINKKDNVATTNSCLFSFYYHEKRQFVSTHAS